MKLNDELLSDLICFIHQDGGQYIEKYGFKKAYEDAINKVLEYFSDSNKSKRKFWKPAKQEFENAKEQHCGNCSHGILYKGSPCGIPTTNIIEDGIKKIHFTCSGKKIEIG